MQYPSTKSYDEKGFAPPLKPGDYTIKLTAIKETDENGAPLTDKNGFDYALFEFSVSDFPDNKLFDRFCFDENNPHANINLGRFKQLLIAVEVHTDVSGDTNTLINKTCKATVKVKDYEGKTYNNISEYKPSDGSFTSSSKEDENLPF